MIERMEEKIKRVGILGGTFNPPHLGHQIMAQTAWEACRLDEVVFLPTGTVPHKDNAVILPAVHRLEMVQRITEGNAHFSVCAVEAKQRKVGYTAETLETLHGIYKDAALYFLLGADSLDYIERWYQPARIFQLCTVCVFARHGIEQARLQKQIEKLERTFQTSIVRIEMPRIEISSTDLRKRIQEGKSIRYLVDDRVEAYIMENGLYRSQTEGGAEHG